MRDELIVVPTGAANTASVVASFRRLDLTPSVVSDAGRLAKAPMVVVPGVGTFASAMSTLESGGLADALAARIADARPTLGICVGLQILGGSSEENPGVAGLGVIDAVASQLHPGVSRPQLGWNRVDASPDAELLTSGWAYFANSYRLAAEPPGWISSTVEHGDRFVASIERGPVLACQFHPELSGEWGTNLLRRWVSVSRKAA